MKASIVIPNLNGAGWLRDSIESIWAQTEQDFELIIIDNGSTDESLAIARSYMGRSGYTLVENQTNTGFSAAVNTGIGLAKGEYVVLFNNDAFAQPDWLAQLIAMADAEPRAFAVQSLMIRHFERDICDDAGGLCHAVRVGVQAGRRHVLAALYKAWARFFRLRRGQPVPQKHFG